MAEEAFKATGAKGEDRVSHAVEHIATRMDGFTTLATTIADALERQNELLAGILAALHNAPSVKP
jgi:hypothetical protein